MIQFDLSNLSKREKRYFDVMRSGNVLYLRGRPGSAKSAMGEAISKKIIWWDDEDVNLIKHQGLHYEDLRLADKDETDLGSYPVLKNVIDQLLKFGKLLELGFITPEEFEKVKNKFFKVINSDDIDTLNFAVPDWAVKCNSTPSIIHVEELNRCDKRVRDAALQLLNEKRIGSYFKFNQNVFWMASGNYGDMDGTEVDEMDKALSNRLTILDHELFPDEWATQYGREHCWGVLVDYVVNNPAEFDKNPPEGELRYASARSWTNLSNYILTVFGRNPDLKDVTESEDFLIVGMGIIGVSMTAFRTYCENTVQVSIKDIYEKWDDVKDTVVTFNRSRTTDLMNNLKVIQLETLETKHIENIIKFLKSLCSEWNDDWEYLIDDRVYYEGYSYRCKKRNIGELPENNTTYWERKEETDSMKSHSNDDEITNYLLHLVDNLYPKNQDRHKYIIRVFKKKAQIIKKWVDNGRHGKVSDMK